MTTSGSLAVGSANLLLTLGVWALESANALLSVLRWGIVTFRDLAPLIVLAILVGVFFAVRGIIREMGKNRYITLEDVFGLTPASAKQNNKAWEAIENRLKSKEPSQYKLAVIEADDLFFDLLLAMGHKGATMEERLKWFRSNKSKFLDDVEKGHAVAEDLFNDEGKQITQDGARQIVSVYQKAFKELGVLEKEEKE